MDHHITARTAALKRKLITPWPFLRWVAVIKKIREHFAWRRAWAARDRIAFLKQFTPEGIRFFVEDGCPEWQDPFNQRPDRSYANIQRPWIAASR